MQFIKIYYQIVCSFFAIIFEHSILPAPISLWNKINEDNKQKKKEWKGEEEIIMFYYFCDHPIVFDFDEALETIFIFFSILNERKWDVC